MKYELLEYSFIETPLHIQRWVHPEIEYTPLTRKEKRKEVIDNVKKVVIIIFLRLLQALCFGAGYYMLMKLIA